MSKKNIPKPLNPLPSIGKSNKKGKKETLGELGAFINDQSDISPDPSSEQAPRLRKLKKLGDKNKEQQQRFIKQKSESEYQGESESEQKSQEKDQSFERFQRLNDQQLAQVQNDMMNKKGKSKNKAKKGEQQIDKYFEKHKGEQKMKKSVGKQKKQPSNTQMSLKAMFQFSSQPKPAQQTSSKIQEQNKSSSSGSEDQLQLYRKRQAMNKATNNINAGLNEEQAIKKAMMQSLKDVKKSQPDSKPIDNYAFSRMMNTRQTPNVIPKQQIKKSISKPQIASKAQKVSKPETGNRKREKSVGKKQKQEKPHKQGPLKGYGIVLTGEFEPYSKNQILELIEKLGADTPKSITKKTTHLLQGCYVVNSFGKRTDQDVKTTNKSVEAAQKKVTIIAFENIDDFFIQKTGKSLQQNMENDKPLKQTKFDEKLIQINKNTTSATKTVAQYENIGIQKNKQMYQHNSSISVPWTEKYKPKSSEQIIGQNGQIKNLREWLQVWEDIHIRGNKREVKQSYNSFMPSGTINSNAALLSGDAGLGKTTAARLIASQFGYSIVQYNASDARNKKSVELISGGKNNLSFLANKSKQMLKTLIIMDQVDGMSSGDRGGIAAIIDMIKKTKIPIICICNDRQAMKIRSLAAHCYDIKFHKPDQRLIIKRLQKIIQMQGGTSSSIALKSLVQLLQNDIRQILTYLQVIFKGGNKSINEQIIRRRCGNIKDNSLTINHFDATKILLSRTMFKQMTISQRIQLCYVDSDMVPLMVHQNYLDACPKKKLTAREFKKLALATDGFALGDKLEKTIMRNQNYCLMPNKMFLSCIYPCQMICENIGFPKFTQWLGKFSSQRKNKRLVKQLKNQLSCVTSVTFQSVKNHFAPMLMQRIYQYLRASQPNYDSIVLFMIHYGITPAVLNEHLMSLQFGKDRQNILKDIETIKKSKLTRIFNKKHETLKMKKQKKKAAVVQHMKYDPVLGEMQRESEEEEQQNDDQKSGSDSEMVLEKKPTKSKAKKK